MHACACLTSAVHVMHDCFIHTYSMPVISWPYYNSMGTIILLILLLEKERLDLLVSYCLVPTGLHHCHISLSKASLFFTAKLCPPKIILATENSVYLLLWRPLAHSAVTDLTPRSCIGFASCHLINEHFPFFKKGKGHRYLTLRPCLAAHSYSHLNHCFTL